MPEPSSRQPLQSISAPVVESALVLVGLGPEVVVLPLSVTGVLVVGSEDSLAAPEASVLPSSGQADRSSVATRAKERMRSIETMGGSMGPMLRAFKRARQPSPGCSSTTPAHGGGPSKLPPTARREPSSKPYTACSKRAVGDGRAT